MVWLLYIVCFVIGIFGGLVLFAWFEKELITKLLLLKAEILYCVKQELQNHNAKKNKKRGKKCTP
jgi:hypothetical protein